MPTLLTPDALKTAVPDWQIYCTLPGNPPPQTPDAVLTVKMDEAEDELSEYVVLDGPEELTSALRGHLIVIVRKRLFDLLHGAKPFERAPQVVQDYNRTLKTLERYQAGTLDVAQPGQTTPDAGDTDGPRHVRMKAKERRFTGSTGGWFH